MTDLIHVVNDRGIVFHVRVVLPGEPYGHLNSLTNDDDQPMVEFYDTRHTVGFGPLGQFVSRYTLDTLIGFQLYGGIQLYGNEPDWTVNAENVAAAIAHAIRRTQTTAEPRSNDVTTYKIIRFYQDHEREVITRGLTLEQAQEHCNDPETSSKTATSEHAVERTNKMGDWFDGFEQEN